MTSIGCRVIQLIRTNRTINFFLPNYEIEVKPTTVNRWYTLDALYLVCHRIFVIFASCYRFSQAREWMSNPDFARQTKYFFKRVDPGKTKALLKFGKDTTYRFIRVITGHGFLRKQNAYVAHGTNKGIPFEEIKCRMCGEAKEEPAHIIRECEAFCLERLEAFNYLECPPDMEWTVNQMMRFLNKTRVRNLEEEEETDN